MLVIGVGNLIFHPYGQSFLQAIASVYPGYHASPSVFDVVVGTLYGAVDGASGVLISGDNNTIRGLVISGFVTGIEITYSPDRTSSNNRLEQNYIGTDSSGTSAVANAGSGILIRGFGSPCCQAADNVVEENLISGNRQNGLLLCDAARTLIAGNLIGTDITGLADLGNGGSGIATICAGSPSNHMEANTVAYNGLDGFLDVTDYNFAVGLTPQGHQGNLLTENSIHSNGRLGINLVPPPGGADGVTPTAVQIS